jgi:hypothetical protein
MTTQATASVAGQIRPVPAEPRHRHSSACYWDVDDCHWQCLTYPLVRYALEHSSASERPGADTGPETQP